MIPSKFPWPHKKMVALCFGPVARAETFWDSGGYCGRSDGYLYELRYWDDRITYEGKYESHLFVFKPLDM